jgi:uncharacterized protein with FMN-binding domain
MVRAVLALSMTAVGIVLLVSFKTPDTAAGSTPAPAAVATDGGPAPTPATAGGNPPDTSSTVQSGSQSSTAGTFKDGTYTGQDFQNQYGDVQVKVTVSGGRITDVAALQLPSDRSRSQEISQQAGPLLHDEAVQAQSAQIDLLTGATYTSDGYQRSLQSALDQAH